MYSKDMVPTKSVINNEHQMIEWASLCTVASLSVVVT